MARTQRTLLLRALALLALAALAAADAADCHKSESKAECLGKDGCVFCQASLVPSGCFINSEAKLLPGFMYNCTGGDGPSPSPSATASAASAPAPPVTKKGGGGSSGGGGGQGAQCSDLKDKKGCRTAKAGCAWCVGKFTPPMCVEEDQAKYLPAMVYECKGPKKAAAAAPLEAAADGDGADDEDEEEEQAQEEEAGARLAVALFEVEKGKKKKDDDQQGCSDLKDKKACRTAKAGCSWCEGTYSPPMCVDEAQAKYLPPSVFTCKGPKKDASSGSALVEGGESDGDDDEDDLEKGGKKDKKKKKAKKCKDLKDRDACVHSKAVCSWCNGKLAPSLCFDEDAAKYLPPMVFDCEPSKRSDNDGDKPNAAGAGDVEGKRKKKDKKKKHDDDDDKQMCSSIKDAKACRRAKAGCSWCAGAFTPAMCLDAAQAQWLPAMVFNCKGPKKGSKGDNGAADDSNGDSPIPSGGDACAELEGRKACARAGGGCRWCEGAGGVVGQCFSPERARMLPASLFKCDSPASGPWPAAAGGRKGAPAGAHFIAERRRR